MEQKFTFKRLLSLIVVATMLFSTFAMLAVPAGAEELFWAEGDYTIADGGNYSANHAYGYVFDIAGVDVAPAESNTIFTSDETWKTTNGWAVSVVLELVEGDVYEVVAVYNAPQLSGDWKNSVEALTEGQIVLMAHSSASKPVMEDAEGNPLTEPLYANWQDKVAAVALANTIGARVTLAGIDLENKTIENATATVQDAPAADDEDGITVDGDLSDWADDWTLVNGETGYWQSVPTDENELAGSYNFQITSDDTNVYVAAEISGLTCTAFRIWFRTNPEATVYTHFYHIDATGAAGKANTSTTANAAQAIEDSAAVGVFAEGADSIIVEFSVPLSEIGATGGDVEYYANTQSGTTLFYPPVVDGEGGSRTANLPYSNWYVAPAEPEPDPEPEVPTESKNVALNKDYTISGCGTTYGQYTASLTDGAAQTTISYDANWFTFYNNGSDASIINAPGGVGYVIIDLTESYNVTTVKANVMDLQGASGIKGPKSVKAYLSADGETWGEVVELDLSAFVSASESFVAVANIEGEAQFVKVEFELDGIFAFVNEIEVYADVPVEEEPTPDPEVVPYIIPVGSINAYGWGNDGYPVILGYGEGKDVVATVGGAWFEWWFKVKAEWNETEGAFVVNATGAVGNKDYEAWTLNANEIMFLVFSGTETYAAEKDIIAGLEVGDKLYASGFDFTNASANNLIVDGVSTVNFSNVAFEEEPDPEDPGVELPEDAIVLDYAGYIHDYYFMIVAGDNMTVAELTALGHGEAKDMNYCVVAVVGADNVITEMHTTLGRPDGVKSDV
ncbi:MAG: hypothetical protein IKK70_03765, partial [Clostridia bacterium]|nr:hypothetical protein [Clostridia bacterium]